MAYQEKLEIKELQDLEEWLVAQENMVQEAHLEREGVSVPLA